MKESISMAHIGPRENFDYQTIFADIKAILSNILPLINHFLSPFEGIMTVYRMIKGCVVSV